MRSLTFVQILLFIVGITVVCVIGFGLGAGILAELTVFRRDPREHGTSAWGGAYGILACMLLGGVIGAATGLAITLTSVFSGENRPWKRSTWLGIGGGVIIGLWIRLQMSVNDWTYGVSDVIREYVLGLAILLICTGTVGGLLGRLVGAFLSMGKTRKRKSVR